MGRRKKAPSEKLSALIQAYVKPQEKIDFEKDAEEEGRSASMKIREFVINENKKNRKEKE